MTMNRNDTQYAFLCIPGGTDHSYQVWTSDIFHINGTCAITVHLASHEGLANLIDNGHQNSLFKLVRVSWDKEAQTNFVKEYEGLSLKTRLGEQVMVLECPIDE